MATITYELLTLREEPADTQDAFFWNLSKFAEACGQATAYVDGPRSKHDEFAAMARKHARRLAVLAGISLDQHGRNLINEMLR